MPASTLARVGLHTRRAQLVAATLVLGVGAAALSIDTASAALIGARDRVVEHFDWLFVLVATLSVGAVALLAIHPRGDLRLGPDDAPPEFGRTSWFAMLFSAGLASGLLYWATAEPILHHQGNPFLAAAGAEAAGERVTTALRITVLHWGLHGWAFYVLTGLAIAVYSYRHGRPLTFRSALLPVLGRDRVDRWPGFAADVLAIFGTVFGVATSIGISAAAMNATLGPLLDLRVTLPNQIAIVFVVCALGILSVLSGLARGIRRLSEVNVWASAALLVVFVWVGPSAFLAGLFVQTLADYTLHVLPAGVWLAETRADRSWQAEWTVFYWGWWLAWTPFVSLFVARISKGRTLREFVVAVMLVPTLVIVVWMSVLGGTALHQELATPGAVSTAVARDYSLGIVAVIERLGSPALGAALSGVVALLLFTWLVTSLDSATLVICHLVGSEDAAPAKVFWGLALGTVTAVLLLVGGLEALQAASIVIGLPLGVLVLALGAGLLWDLARGRL